MGRFRFSLASLMAIVGLVAITFAGLRSESTIWFRVLPTLVFAVLLASVVGAVYDVARHRAFWIGFAVFGWGHWFVAYAPGMRLASSTLLPEGLSSYLYLGSSTLKKRTL